MRIIVKILWIGVAMAMLSACTTPRGAALQSEILHEANSDQPTFAVEEVTRANVATFAKWPATGWHGHFHWLKAARGPDTSTIQAGDRVNLTIWDNQANSLLTPAGQKNIQMLSMRVSATGSIFVPYVEEVTVRGLSEDQARAHIQRELEPIAPSAQVQLELVPGQGNSVDLVSGVAQPGTYPLPSKNYSILSLLAQGGGISDEMRNPIVRLIRGSKTYETPAAELFSKASRNVRLRGGDKVLVSEDERYFTALGATGTEQIVYFDKESISALEALSMLGGLADNRANPQGVLILREYTPEHYGKPGPGPSHSQVIFTLDLTSADGLFAARNFMVHPQDTVLATESPLRTAQTILKVFGTALGITNRVNNL